MYTFSASFRFKRFCKKLAFRAFKSQASNLKPQTQIPNPEAHTSNLKPKISNLTPQNHKSQDQKSSWETIRCRSEEILKNPWIPDLYPKPQISNFKSQISEQNLKPRIQILNLKSRT